jgi:hypothetical protein
MSQKPENAFISGVHKYLPPEAELYRMKNNNEFAAGIADMWYSGKKSDIWIEYKLFKDLPARDDTMVGVCRGKTPMLSHLQQHWLRGRHAEGRNVAVIIGLQGAGGVWLPGLDWEREWPTHVFKTMVMSRRDLAEIITAITMKGTPL